VAVSYHIKICKLSGIIHIKVFFFFFFFQNIRRTFRSSVFITSIAAAFSTLPVIAKLNDESVPHMAPNLKFLILFFINVCSSRTFNVC
jgi:hypothetical protein